MANSEIGVTYLENPEKLENDNKYYRNVVLANGLHALLVTHLNPDDVASSFGDAIKDSCAVESQGSDDKVTTNVDTTKDDEKIAEMSLLVDVGTFTDPTKYKGLARLLAHMIFMGSEKYPTEDALDNHLEKCNGSQNATTWIDATLCCVNVPKKHLQSCMDYLTASLKAPLLLKEAMVKATEEIESKFQETLQNDGARRHQLLASSANTDYPHSKFIWGYFKSLKENVDVDDLHKNLLEFFKCHYSGVNLGATKLQLWSQDMTVVFQQSEFHRTPIYYLFTLCINLTDSGFKHLDEILAATSAYIKLISPCGALKSVNEDFARIIEGGFKAVGRVYDTARDMVQRYKSYPVKHMFTSGPYYFEYDEDEIQNVIRHLNEYSFNVMTTTQQKYDDDITYGKKEKWFGTEYSSIKMPQKWQEVWNNCQTLPELQLPQANPFVATDYHLFWIENGRPEIPLSPMKLLENDICELWFRQDDKFNSPLVCSYFSFLSPLLGQSPKYAVMDFLYSDLLNQHFKEELYLAERSCMNCALISNERGMSWWLSGFNDKFQLFVETVGNAFVSLRRHITEDKFDACKTNFKKYIFNSLVNPDKLKKDIYESVMLERHWPLMEKYKCIDDISLDDMLEFAEKYTQELYVKTIIQGNFTEELSLNVMNSLLAILNCKKIQEPKCIQLRNVQLPQGSHYIRCNALDEKHARTIVFNIYQCGPTSDRLESILELYTTLIEDPMFDALRTEGQLRSHPIKSATYRGCGVICYSIDVNSEESQDAASHLDNRIESFRDKMLHFLVAMAEAEFEKVRESAIKKWQPIDTFVFDEMARNVTEIVEEHYRFDGNCKVVEILKTLKKQDIIEFCENEKLNMRKLSILVIGNVNNSRCAMAEEKLDDELISEENGETTNAEEGVENFDDLFDKLDLKFIPREDDATFIVDIQDFKDKLYVYEYPINKTELKTPVVDL